MNQRSVIIAELFTHHPFINNKLVSKCTRGFILVEFDSFDKLLFLVILMVSILFVSFDDWHAPHVRLNDFKRKIMYVVLIILSLQVTRHSNFCFVIVFVFSIGFVNVVFSLIVLL